MSIEELVAETMKELSRQKIQEIAASLQEHKALLGLLLEETRPDHVVEDKA